MLLSELCRAAGYESSCRIDSAVTDFPEPLSPTSATVSPRSSSNETPVTASTTWSPALKVTERFVAERSGCDIGSHPLAGIEGVAHGLADEHHEREQGREGEEGSEAEPGCVQVGLALRHQIAERGRARRQA